MHDGAQLTLTFAVDDAQREHALGATGEHVVPHQRLDLSGLKRVQIEHAIEWQHHGRVWIEVVVDHLAELSAKL